MLKLYNLSCAVDLTHIKKKESQVVLLPPYVTLKKVYNFNYISTCRVTWDSSHFRALSGKCIYFNVKDKLREIIFSSQVPV